MSHTAMVWTLVLVALATVTAVTANKRIEFLTDSEIPEEEYNYDYDYGVESKIAGKRSGVCSASDKCILFGGFCVKSRAECDGMVDRRGCSGRRCKCCIPVPPCLSTTDATTDMTTPTPDTSSASSSTEVPCSFEDFHGRSIRRPLTSDPKYDNWDQAMSFCDQCGSKPFIPRTEADYGLYREVKANFGVTLDDSMWLPANDIKEEGTLHWYDGELATEHITLWEWPGQNNELVMSGNSNPDNDDCLFYGNGYNGGPVSAVIMILCNNAFDAYPPICEKL